MEKIAIITGFEIQGEMQAIAFMVVTDEDMIQVRDALKPHRGSLRRIKKILNSTMYYKLEFSLLMDFSSSSLINLIRINRNSSIS
jgi:hypothetical protein